jgi:type I restriction enzyme S subunit
MEVRPGYKQTEVGVLPQEWQDVLLDRIAKRGSGHTPDKKHEEYWNGDIKWLSLADSGALDRVFINDTTSKITPQGLANSSAVLHPAGTVVLSRDAGIGKSAIMRSEMAVSQHFMAWQCGPELENYLLYYWLQAAKPTFEQISNGTTIKTIGLQYFKGIKVPLPPRREQRAISAALSDVDALLDGLDRLIAKKRDLKQAAMQQLLTGQTRLPGFQGEWEVKRLGDVVQVQKGQLITTSTLLPGDIPVIAGGKQPAYFHATANRHGRTITISASGASAGYVALYDVPIFASDCSTISESANYCLDFIFYQLLWKQQIIYKAQTGGAQPHIHSKDLNPIRFAFPTISEQTAIAAVLADMDAELAALEARRDKTRALKQAMMQELLTGRTRLV